MSSSGPRRSLTRRIATAAFLILALQLACAIGLQFQLSHSLIRESMHRRLADLDQIGFLDGCEAQPDPWVQRESRWSAWPIAADGRVLGSGAPRERVELPPVGRSTTIEIEGHPATIYASEAPGCSGMLLILSRNYPLIQALPREFMALAVGRLVLFVLAGVAMVTLTAGPLVHRIRALVERMNEVVDNDFAGKVELTANDELGELALAFDTAARTAHERLTKLEHRDALLRRALADLAHDLRTPLATLKLSASSLADSPEVRAIRTELSYLEGMTHNFEALIGDDEGLEREEVELDRLVERLELRFAPLAAAKGLSFNVALPEGSPRVLAESIALERAVGNLIHNALRWATANVVVLAWVEAEEAILEVRDDGPGLESAGVEVIERGVRGPDARGEGFGLGLAIAEASARRFDGRLELRDGPDSGTRARIVLPVV